MDTAKNANEDSAAKLILTRQPEMIHSIDPDNNHDTILHRAFGSRLTHEKVMYSEDLMLLCWQMINPEEALRQTNDENDTPFVNAVRYGNSFAIELVQSRLPIDEIAEAYVKCEKPYPQTILDSLSCRELLLDGLLNEDVMGVVREYILGSKDKPPNKNKRRREDDQDEGDLEE